KETHNEAFTLASKKTNKSRLRFRMDFKAAKTLTIEFFVQKECEGTIEVKSCVKNALMQQKKNPQFLGAEKQNYVCAM
ncbi:hypothetical protein, partial [Salmonella enterica]|uniref:hypothetical protein n=1 Tax=Salmonella enterica TaxID=28901 RepID=UPI001EE7F549